MLSHGVTFNFSTAKCFHLPYLTHISHITKIHGLVKLIIICSVGLSCQKHPGPLVQELKKVVCPSQKLSAQIFLPFLQLLKLFS